uniref:Uncharacterized protein n=1 Tax=Solibacter usitatus (strain Ellin6076) TaxID=234267 RepID=Q023M1_SOLUE
MQAGSTSARPFLRKLAAALPANFVVFWLVLGSNLPAVLPLTAIGATLGALLLAAVDGPLAGAPTQAARNRQPRGRATVHEFPRPA